MRLVNLPHYKALGGLIFLIHCAAALASITTLPIADADNSVSIDLAWQGEADAELWLIAPSGEIIRSTHPVGESVPVWLEMVETTPANTVRQRLHIEYQLAEGQYQIAVQRLFSRSDIHYQVIMRQGTRLLRSVSGQIARSAEWSTTVQRLWMLGADEAWNRALPLPLLREQFQGGWQLQVAAQVRVYIRLQGQSMELQVYEDGECQWLALQDAIALPGGLRWQQEQLWLHTAFFSDLLYGAVGEDEFLPMQQASWPEGECEGMSF